MGIKPQWVSVAVHVVRGSPGQRQRIYRQFWSGRVCADFNLRADQPDACRIMLLESAHGQSCTVLQMRADSFAVDQLTSRAALIRHMAALGVREGYQLSVCPSGFSGARGPGPARLAPPLLSADARAFAAPVGAGYQMQMSVLQLAADGLSQIYHARAATRSFLALPVGPMRFADFDAHYLLTDQPGGYGLVHSACCDGFSSFSLTTCRSEEQAVAVLLDRGVTARMAASSGLAVPAARPDAPILPRNHLK